MGRRLTAYQKTVREGSPGGLQRGLGEMPLTLWVLVAGVILYLYIRRASLGIDKHPGEVKQVMIKPQSSVFIGPIAPPASPVDLTGPSMGPTPHEPSPWRPQPRPGDINLGTIWHWLNTVPK